LLLAQSTGGGAVVAVAADPDGGAGAGADGDVVGAEDGAAGWDRDEGGDVAEEGDDDGGADVVATRCAARSVAEIGRQATMSTPMINIQRVTLAITPGSSPGVDQPHRYDE
jgi:hypothetical protein